MQDCRKMGDDLYRNTSATSYMLDHIIKSCVIPPPQDANLTNEDKSKKKDVIPEEGLQDGEAGEKEVEEGVGEESDDGDMPDVDQQTQTYISNHLNEATIEGEDLQLLTRDRIPPMKRMLCW